MRTTFGRLLVQVSRSLLSLSLLLISTSCTATAETDEPLEQRAQRFVETFFQGPEAELEELMAPKMRSELTEDKRQMIRKQLLDEFGQPESFGEASFVDRPKDFERYEVPVYFESSLLEIRVSVSLKGGVLGFFVQEPRERPREKTDG